MLSSSDPCVCYVSVCPLCRAVATSPTCVAFPCVNVVGVCVSSAAIKARSVTVVRASPAPHIYSGQADLTSLL
ncbi:unnamed protein product [Lasius platythorax]|uniref:Secreted protein n=1 Tax=Lasius platythorax TaxID=488582 RepID=A0AAV2NW88_9HYME